jgi:hypothetical protein
MEDEGTSSNRGKQIAPEVAEAAATSTTSTSSSESGKICGLDWSASSRESGSTSSSSSSDENSGSDGSYVEIMPSDTDVGKRVLVDVEEGEIGVETDAAM